VERPLAPERCRAQFTLSRHDTFPRVQELVRHNAPDGDPAAIFDRAFTLLLDPLEEQKLAAATKPRNDNADAQYTTGSLGELAMRPRRCGEPCGRATQHGAPLRARMAAPRLIRAR
jgi:hypothetical protein